MNINNSNDICEENIDLRLCQFDAVDYFDFSGNKCLVKVVDIYDGDTCTVIFIFRRNLYKYRCRLLGINATELKPPLEAMDRLDLIKRAKLSRDRLAQLILGEHLLPGERSELRKRLSESHRLNWAIFHQFDKYGRLLIELCAEENPDPEGKTINQQLLSEGLVEAY